MVIILSFRYNFKKWIIILQKVVLIGASTGGPGEIQKIISALPKLQNSSIIVAQHMASEFIPSFVKRMQEFSKNPIYLAKDNLAFESLAIYFCDSTLEIVQNGFEYLFKKALNNSGFVYNPNINTIFNSFVPLSAKFKIMCVVLTGIGDDALDACLNLSSKGVAIYTQTKEDAIVDGMPYRIRESIKDAKAQSTQDIIKSIVEFVE